MLTSISTKLGIHPGETIFLACVCLFLAGLLVWTGYHQRPTRQPETMEQLAQEAADCFRNGGEVYSVKGGCE